MDKKTKYFKLGFENNLFYNLEKRIQINIWSFSKISLKIFLFSFYQTDIF